MAKRENTLVGVGLLALLGFILWKRNQGPTATVTTSEGFDLSAYGGPVTYPQPLIDYAHAIARAEGFGIPGALPTRNHNPGDLTDSSGTIIAFGSDDEGWNALYRQLWLIVQGQSGHYNLDMTIGDMAQVWTATQQDAWASNVAGALGVPVETPLYSVLV